MNIHEEVLPEILTDVYDDLHKDYSSSNTIINVILEDIFSRRGKGARPLFMALSSRLTGGEWDSLRKAAAVVEAVHIASLLHDDVVDDSNMRRGVATLNTLHSNKVSILFGDYMYMKAMKTAETINNDEVIPILQDAFERMVEGEIRDSLTTGPVDEKMYLSIIKDKTASLFAASGELGILLGGGGDRERSWAREMGESVGMAFQIMDDILDYRGDARVMGKSNMMDLKTGCMTLPLIYSLRGYTNGEVEDILYKGRHDIESLSVVVTNNGGVEYATMQAYGYIDRCRNILDRFEKPDIKEDFEQYFTMMVSRHFK
ncbi:MAG: polyprenyl synthetase family protein [Candidatus Latescibacterota bacterium]